MNKTLKKYLGYKGYIVIDKANLNENKIGENELLQVIASYANYGFKLNSKSLNNLKNISLDAFSLFYNSSLNLLKEIKGLTHHPVMYKNFPNMENVTSSEYIINAIFHYLTATCDNYGYMPNSEIEKRKLEDYALFTEINVINESEARKILINNVNSMLEATKVITEKDLNVLEEVYKLEPNSINPQVIPFKCNLANLVKIITLDKNGKVRKESIVSALSLLSSSIQTLTDLLRIYSVVSGGDVELKGDIQFISLPRKARRQFIYLIDKVVKKNQSSIDEAVRFEFLWKRAFEKLHIGEYSDIYKDACDLAYNLRSNNYQTYNSQINEAILKKDEIALLRLLQIKPGVYARSLDYILRLDWINKSNVLIAFEKVVSNISSRVLISLWEHFKSPRNGDERFISYRYGLRYVSSIVQETRLQLDNDIIEKTISIIEMALMEKYKNKETIEKVYLDPCMKNYTLPTNNRNASSGLNTLSFASKVTIPNNLNKPVLRFFTHWKNPNKQRVDIDLSLELFDEDFNYLTSLSWFNMEGGKFINSYHSGDIVTAPNGASEFIDLNIEEAKKKKVKYAVISNSVFTGQSYCDIDECFSGVMFRSEFGKKGEIFEAKTVKTKFDLTQKGVNRICSLAFDIYSNQLIWLDTPYYDMERCVVASKHRDVISYLLKKATSIHMTIYDLVLLHKKHVTFVTNPYDCTKVINDSEESLISPNNLEALAKDWID